MISSQSSSLQTVLSINVESELFKIVKSMFTTLSQPFEFVRVFVMVSLSYNVSPSRINTSQTVLSTNIVSE